MKAGLALTLALVPILAGALAACSGQGSYTKEAFDEATEKMARMRAAADYDLAHQQFSSNELESALETIGRVVTADPEVPYGHLLRGRILLEYGRTDEALVEIERAIELDAEDPGSHYVHGVALERAGRVDDAVDAYLETARLDASAHEAVLAAAELRIEEGREAEATALLESREEYRWVGGFRQTLGHVAMMHGDIDRAILLFGEAVTLDPDDPSFREDLARAQLIAGRFLDAESNLAQVRQDSKVAARRDLMHLQAACLIELDQPVEARAILYDLTRTDEGKNDLQAWRRLADVAMVLDDATLLRRVSRRLIAIAPSQSYGYLTYALWQRKQGDLDGALDSVRQAKQRATGRDAETVTELERILVDQRGA